MNYRLYDVSGLKYHRTKWLNHFDHVNSILFVTDISSYDQVLVEDGNINRMHDAIQLFYKIRDTKELSKASIILFLNKTDRFKKKVKKIPI